MITSFKIPDFLQFKTKFGLLIADSEVHLVSWNRGNLRRIGVFSNDDTGAARLLAFLTKNNKQFKDRPFYILINIIGEDYRLEKTAHLLGKYKTDFHAKRIQQLFRGSQFAMSEVQGREERGKREDWVLFSGVLTEGKVLPWVNILTRGGRYIEGVHMVAHMLSGSVLGILGSAKGNNLVMTIHEHGLLRQTCFINGKLRFSRVSKIADDSAEHVGASIKRELERTLQYLGSLKISIAGGMTVRVVSPGGMVGQLREIIASGERIKFDFQDASQVAQKIGLKTPVEALGRDSSLPLHLMFSREHLSQLAKLSMVIYNRVQMMTKAALVVCFFYALNAYWTPFSNFREGYGSAAKVTELFEETKKLEREYNAQLQSVVGEPPSSPENMQAVSDLYTVLENIIVNPTQMMYFIGQRVLSNPKVRIKNIEWELSNSTNPGKMDVVVVSGGDVYQIVQVDGEFLEAKKGETYRDVADRADKLIESFQGRDDIHVEVLEIPDRNLSTENLSGTLSADLDVDAPSSRDFSLKIVWKEYDKKGLNRIVNEI